MGRNPKFRPTITRVKLNPEQAVLACLCYTNGRRFGYDFPRRPKAIACGTNFNWQKEIKRSKNWHDFNASS